MKLGSRANREMNCGFFQNDRAPGEALVQKADLAAFVFFPNSGVY